MPVLTRKPEHFTATYLPTGRLLMMHWHHCGELKQVTAVWET